MNIAQLLPQPRTSQQRATQAARQDLRRQLAAYQTPSDIADLMAMLEDQDTPEAAEVRQILAENLQSFHRRTRHV